jgi:hypothetical protein
VYSSSDGQHWSHVSTTGNPGTYSGRGYFQCVVFSTHSIYLTGGVYGSYQEMTSDSWMSSNGGANWTQVQTMPAYTYPERASFASASYFSTRDNADIWVIAGGSYWYNANNVYNGQTA